MLVLLALSKIIRVLNYCNVKMSNTERKNKQTNNQHGYSGSNAHSPDTLKMTLLIWPQNNISILKRNGPPKTAG